MIQDDQVRCDWCGNGDFAKEETMLLDISLPFYTGPRMHIKNHLCPSCHAKTLEALGNLELDIKTGLDA